MSKNKTDRQLFLGSDRSREELPSFACCQSSIELSVGSLPLPFGFVFSGRIVGWFFMRWALKERKSLQRVEHSWGRTTADTNEVWAGSADS